MCIPWTQPLLAVTNPFSQGDLSGNCIRQLQNSVFGSRLAELASRTSDNDEASARTVNGLHEPAYAPTMAWHRAKSARSSTPCLRLSIAPAGTGMSLDLHGYWMSALTSCKDHTCGQNLAG